MNIGIVSQVRMTSTRLPGKVLQKIKGKSLLQYHVERLALSKLPIYIATTINSQDDAIEDFCRDFSLPIFRGSELDVLSRYVGLIHRFNLDVVVRVTSDCPLIDGHIIAEAVQRYKDLGADWRLYLSNCQKRTFPRGFDFEIVSAKALLYADEHATEDYEREHVTPYVWKTRPDFFDIQHWVRAYDASKFRITVDEPDDFRAVQDLIEKHKADHLGAEQIIHLLEAHSEIYEINKHVEQKKV